MRPGPFLLCYSGYQATTMDTQFFSISNLDCNLGWCHGKVDCVAGIRRVDSIFIFVVQYPAIKVSTGQNCVRPKTFTFQKDYVIVT